MNIDVVQIISTLGFPVAMCVGACFFIKYLFDSFTKQQADMRAEHRDEISKLQSSLDNNTLALTRLIDKLDKE